MGQLAQPKKRTDSRQDLYSSISDVICQIETLNTQDDCAPFASQLRQNNKAAFSSLGEETALLASKKMATCQLQIIKEIPTIVQAMLDGIDLRTTEPAIKCALAGALAYLVKPRDLLRDNLPGGYGFVDDCMILRATVSEFKNILPPEFTTNEKELRLLKLLGTSIPAGLKSELMEEIDGLWLTFHSLLWASEDDVENLTEDIIRDPFGSIIPTSTRDTLPLPPTKRYKIDPNSFTVSLENDVVSIVISDNATLTIDANGKLNG